MGEIDPKALHQHLTDWKVFNIFHANTLSTSCTYLKEKFLFSRQAIETNGLFQTPQMSDELDKKYGIWDDIFF